MRFQGGHHACPDESGSFRLVDESHRYRCASNGLDFVVITIASIRERD